MCDVDHFMCDMNSSYACVAVCCGVLHRVAVCCSVLQPSYVWNELFIRVRNDSSIRRKRLFRRGISEILHEYWTCVTWVFMWHTSFVEACNASFVEVQYSCEISHIKCLTCPHLSLIEAFQKYWTCVTWLIHMFDMTHSYMRHDSFKFETWLIHMCDMTHACGWHDSCMCVTWPFTCMMWHIHMRDITSLI